MARVAHSFTQATTIDVTDNFSIERNPESDLAGVPINSNQSFNNNELDATFETDLTAKAGLKIKAQSVIYHYEAARLGTSLDRTENLFGVSGDYAVLPELKTVGEYRHQIIDYRLAVGNKDKDSDFLLAGADYELAKKVTASGRVGFEHRHRDAERDESAPYAELTTKFDYAQGSYLSAGYVYTLEESSNVDLYTDTQVNRFFVNVQHALTALITASGSLDYEPSQLKGRRGTPDVNETTTRLGFALSYLPTKNWTISLSYDHDNVSSGDPTRGQVRNREGLNAKYSF
jgi:predicted porin